MKTTPQPRILTRRDFQSLLSHENSPCISMFLPTHRTGREQKQDEIRLKNLRTRAERELLSTELSKPTVARLLEPIEALLSDATFWEHQSDGLAIFRSPKMFRFFRLPLRLTEELVVGDRFQVKPMLPLLHTGGRYFVLALSQDSARLFEAGRDSIHELELPEVAPTNADGDETSLQLHSQRRGARATSDEAIYHGQGGREDRTKPQTLNYFRRLNEAVRRVLEGEDAPLVLACVGYLAPIYEAANSYKHLIKAKVPGNPNMWTDDELRERAWTLVEPQFEQRQRASLDHVREAAENSQVLTSLRDAIIAAHRGRIDTMLLRRGEQQWGHVDPELEAVHVTKDEASGIELLNYAAAETLNHGGNVFIVDDIPNTDSPLAAIARY